MQVARTIDGARDALRPIHKTGRTVGLVPTMGYLHEAHLRLVDRCHQLADFVVVSIYVNPLQFGPGEDYERYPRDLARDVELAQERGVSLVFAPDDRQLYPREPAIRVVPRELADRLCGPSRPGHFEGVLTVVAKLFHIIRPDIAVFGQKDFQQSVLIRRMVEDLDMPIRVEVSPTVREPDGLAMSSRNEYLSPEERDRALSISRGLAAALTAYRGGERDVEALRARVRGALTGPAGVDRVEYVEFVTVEDLEPVTRADDETVVAVAAHVGGTRLIDNVVLGRPDPDLEKHLHVSRDE